MAFQNLLVEKKERVAVVRLNRPESQNTLSVALIRELTSFAEQMRDDLGTNVVVLAGSDDLFSAGVDLKDPELVAALAEPVALRRRHFEIGPRMCAAWEDLPQVTIACVNGFCIGGGVSLAVSCDFRVMAKDAFFKVAEIGLGMNYSWGSLARLVNLVGPAWAKRWVITTEEIRTPDAVDSGLVQWTAESGKALERAEEIARKIAEKPQAPVFMTKQTVNALTTANRPVGHMDVDQFALSLTSEDFQEGVKAFLEKRSAVFNKDLPKK